MTPLITGVVLGVVATLVTIFYTRARGRAHKADRAGGVNIVMALLLVGALILSVGLMAGGAVQLGVNFAAGQLK